MKKIMILAAAAALALVSCAKVETIQNTSEEDAISFGVYAGKTASKATYGDITTASLQTSTDGFGVFAYYTMNTAWSSAKTTATPNFMYNQQVKYISEYGTPTDFTAARYPSHWYYSPLKYWPNGQNSTEVAAGTYVDKVSFFAYAPHTVSTPATGVVGTPYPGTGEGITAMSTNSTANAPTVTFTVPTNADEQIDLLWATPITDQTHQNLAGRVSFTFNHALAKLNLQAQAVVDAVSPDTANLIDNGDATLDEGETWILLQSLEVQADGTKTGTLSLNDGSWSGPVSGNSVITYDADAFNYGKTYPGTWSGSNTITVSADSKTGFKVCETARDLNSNISPMIIPAEVASSKFIVSANYWVITKDAALNGGYSTVQQVIKKTSTSAITFAAGKKYTIVVRLGLNSLDFAVTEVTGWDDQSGDPIDLPVNS
ncbi:MAG: fimbrillin family protein [Bacteroidales bacterium]|nr:fimbrillin family protein [Bacteroidales bacterium]